MKDESMAALTALYFCLYFILPPSVFILSFAVLESVMYHRLLDPMPTRTLSTSNCVLLPLKVFS